jgi:hypothetical protein
MVSVGKQVSSLKLLKIRIRAKYFVPVLRVFFTMRMLKITGVVLFDPYSLGTIFGFFIGGITSSGLRLGKDNFNLSSR